MTNAGDGGAILGDGAGATSIRGDAIGDGAAAVVIVVVVTVIPRMGTVRFVFFMPLLLVEMGGGTLNPPHFLLGVCVVVVLGDKCGRGKHSGGNL